MNPGRSLGAMLHFALLSLFFCSNIDIGAGDKVNKEDLPIMMQLKKKYGKKLTELATWRADKDCSSWKLVDCDGDRISGIYFQGTWLGGRFPYIVTKLSALRKWYGDANNFTGIFPDKFSNCKKLQVLRLSGNLLSGHLPASFGGLTDLYKFYVKENRYLSGNIPRTWGKLDFQEVYLDSNRFSGPFPRVICKWKNLERLRMGNNKWKGGIPNCITGLTKMKNLFLDNIGLTGVIPPGIGNMKSLELVFLGGNKLTGPIPESIGNCKNLYSLFLSANNIQGPLPKSMGELTELREWTMEFNAIGGLIPTEIGKMKNVERILLNSNKLHGPIPGEIGNLKKLTMLLLQGNKLSGEVPSSIPRKLKLLDQFNVADNWLSGKVPSNWASKSIRQINIRSNYFFGEPNYYYDNGRLACPKRSVAAWIISSTGYNCLKNSSKCGEDYDEMQRNPSTCARFCGANGPKGPCNGKGRCVWTRPKKLIAVCRCNKGARLSKNRQSCV